MTKFKQLRKQLDELNGQTGPVLRISYRPQKINMRKGLTSFSTVEKSDLYNDITKNHTGREWSMTKNTNSIAIRLPHPKGHEKDRETWMSLLKDAIPGKAGNLIRGGGLTQTEVDELKRDYEKAIKAFGGTKVVSQDHEIYVMHRRPGKLKVEKGLLAMLKALDEFGMRNHVSVSSRDGVLTRIQDAGQYQYHPKGTPLERQALGESVHSSSYPSKVQADKMSWLKKKILMKHYRDLAKGKQSALPKIMKMLKDDVNEESINEDKFQLVNMSRRTAKIADKLAKKVGLDTDFEGNVLGINLTVHGTKRKIKKWLDSLPVDNVDEAVSEDMSSFDGLRIAKYLAHKDGKSWRRMTYGYVSDYLNDADDIMKKDKKRARDILSQPTPRSL